MVTEVEVKKRSNIIFLDMDGVLCNPRACIAAGQNGGLFEYLDPIACLLVRRLCETTNSKIVISSSWRKNHPDRSAMQAILNAACLDLGCYIVYNKVDEFKWRTPTLNTVRGLEINAWWEKYGSEYDKFVILDDSSDMFPHEAKLVRTDAYDGMGYWHYQEAKEILGYEKALKPIYPSPLF